MQYNDIFVFSAVKIEKINKKKYFCYVCSLGEAVLTSTHSLFLIKIRKSVYPCIPQFHIHINWGSKGVYITRACYRNDTVAM